MRVPKKSIVVLSTNSANVIKITTQCDLDPPQKTDEEKCKLYLKILFYIIMTLSFVAIKVSCWIMIYKFVLHQKAKLYFPPKF